MPAKRGNTLIYKGSNYLRQRLILSVLSGRPVQITDIRIQDEEPGLKEFEVNLIRLLDKVTNGTIIELNETGTSLYFQPGLLYGGAIEHDCCTERGIGYYLEALVMFGIFCKQPLNVKLKGVTSNNIDPSVDLIKTSLLQTLKKFVLDDDDLELKICKRGMRPLGGGEVIFRCPVRKQTRPVQLYKSGMVKRIRGTAYALKVSPAMANRIVEKAKGVLLNFIPDVYISVDQCNGKQAGNSPGFGIHLLAETNEGTFYSAEQVSNVVANGEEPSIPEDLGIAAAQRLLYEIYLGGVVDSTSQSLAILCMALGDKDVSKLVTGPLSDYSIWFLRHLRDFLGVTFKLEPFVEDEEYSKNGSSSKVLLTSIGIGYTNISKRTL
ncbi:probable RNA 3'-terminal phosphate cyclase-like protein isoform X1 [Diorhabda carinulata]|uniref:probable RNA 3'-terminal phosphate cyclase-like protein isoform X1 n=1 Tax=Diorhabda carinulata TaxID=1163345 RepID=UPI00259FFC4C|nr:probable RNA 3'-terminal phosphate cyclase-like protein isoform X1 [Diorhabda carinulata]